MGGMVLETNMTEIMLRIEEQNKMEKEEVRLMFLNVTHIGFFIPLRNPVLILLFEFVFEGYSCVRNSTC